jgi:hypothetical protein
MMFVLLLAPPFAVDRTDEGGEVSKMVPVVPETAADALDATSSASGIHSAVETTSARRSHRAVLDLVDQGA